MKLSSELDFSDALAKDLPYRFSVRFHVRHLMLAAQSVVNPLPRTILPSVTILLMHHILADEEALFRSFVHRLHESFTFLTYSEAVERAECGPIDHPYIAFSFDDGLLSSLRAAQILEEFGGSACFFIVPSFVNTDNNKERAQSAYLNLPPMHFFRRSHIDQLLQQGHEIGGHTLTHPNLARCSQEELQEEISQCHAALQQLTSQPMHFAWPYGRWNAITTQAQEYVKRAGFISCASAVRGSYTRPMPNAAAFVRRCSLCAFEGAAINSVLISRSLSNPVRL